MQPQTGSVPVHLKLRAQRSQPRSGLCKQHFHGVCVTCTSRGQCGVSVELAAVQACAG